ncbi:hypothetical protein JW835_10480 [bacterium]|nr:hypothetical protein [bacterium]
MYIINFTYEIAEEDQRVFLERVKSLELFWKAQGFDFSIYRDVSRKSTLVHTFYTDRTVDELSYLIQEHPEAKALFEEIKKSAGKILITVMEQVA